MQNEDDYFYEIKKEIVSIFGKIFASRPYIAIVDGVGNIHHIDAPLSEQHLDFIKEYVKRNFNFLKIGDYSFPLGGINLGFFKISSKAVIVLYTTKGFTGQLLAFKTRMHEWSQKIDEVLGEVTIPASIEQPPTTEKPEAIKPLQSIIKKKRTGFRTVPILVKQLSGKEKFSIDVAQVLNLCDGKHSIEEIVNETSYHKVKVKDIIGEYSKKKWIMMKRVLD